MVAKRTIGFIIPSYVATWDHLNVLKQALSRIRQYHDYPIVIINDHSPVDLNPLMNQFSNVRIELSLRKARGEMNPYLHYYQNRYFDIAIVIQDSMLIKKKLENVEQVSDIKFLRYFICNRSACNITPEPATAYNIQNNIYHHGDLIMHLVTKIENKNKSFYDFCADLYYQKMEWIGCYGMQSIITWDFLNEMQLKTNVLDILDFMKDRRDRMAMEAIFAFACLYAKDTDNSYLMNAYDGVLVTDSNAAFDKISFAR